MRDEESRGSGRSSAAAGHPAGECYACTQPGVPAFHSTTCDQVHEPGWDADAGSSLVPVQAQQQAPPAPASAAQHAGAAARWLFGPVLDPRSKRVRRWNRWILLGRAAALAVDPLFFYALSIGRAGQPCLYMDAGLAAVLRRQCPANPNFNNDPTVVQDIVTPNRLDNQYYKNVLRRKVLFNSDAALLTSGETARKVVENAAVRGRWERKFARALVKMAAIEVKTAANGGEVMRNCRVVN